MHLRIKNTHTHVSRISERVPMNTCSESRYAKLFIMSKGIVAMMKIAGNVKRITSSLAQLIALSLAQLYTGHQEEGGPPSRKCRED